MADRMAVEDLRRHGQGPINAIAYLADPMFISTVFENWESEFLQMAVYVVLTAFLVQRGSSESKDPDTPERDPLPSRKAGAPRLARAAGLMGWLYSHSLGLALGALFPEQHAARRPYLPMTLPPSLADLADEYLVDHYPNAWERAADRWIHIMALALAAIGAAWLVERALFTGRAGLVIAAGLYGAALVCMLAFSAVYNLSHVSTARPALRRLDEAGIFLMIAGSYTPFTTQRLDGAWSIGMTSLVWAIAVAGIVGKLAFPKISERVWTALYVVFGWVR
jgi:hypothetical protein